MNMKKHISFVLLTAILLSLVSSCGNASENEDTSSSDASTESTEVETTETEAVPPVMDLQGYELSILNYDDSWVSWANTRITAEQDADILNDAIYNRNKYIEEKYNFTIKVNEVGSVDGEIAKDVQSGDRPYSIYTMREGALSIFLPYIADWNDIPSLNLDEPWWNPDATSVYDIGGKQTALAGNMTLSAVSRAVCITYNQRLWSELGDPDTNLYSLVRNGEWTVDRFLQTAKSANKDVNGNTEWDEDDIYGLMFGRGFKGYIASFLCGSDMNFTSVNAEGKQEFTLDENEKALSLITKLMDAWTAGDGFEYKAKDDLHGATPENFFENGHALFSQRVPHDIYKLRGMTDDIGILPMPKYDEAQDNYRSAAWGGVVWTLGKDFDMNDAEKLGAALEAMSFYGYRDVVPVYKETALKTKATRDEDSAEMLDIIFGTVYFDFGTNIMFDAVLVSNLIQKLYTAKSSDGIVSKIASSKKSIDKFISDIYKTLEEAE